MELDRCPAKGHPDLTSVLSVATGPWPEQMKPKQRDAETLGWVSQCFPREPRLIFQLNESFIIQHSHFNGPAFCELFEWVPFTHVSITIGLTNCEK